MTLSEQLDQAYEDIGVRVKSEDLTELGLDGHFYFAPGMKRPTVTLNSEIDDPREMNVLKTHELGNCENCVCNVFDLPEDLQEKYRSQVYRWQVRYYMPIEKLIQAFDTGYTTPFELSEFLEISIGEVLRGIALYYQIYGAELQYGQYTIYWDPFNIKRDRRRRSAY